MNRMSPAAIDGVLVQWGDRLFYPGNRIVQDRTPRLRDPSQQPGQRAHADAVRRRIVDTMVRRAPQVMVKVTGGGRGMNAIAAHFRYISKGGRLDIEDDRGEVTNGKGAVPALVEDWRYGGSFIDEVSPRREAFNVMLSMPHGTDPQIVLKAAREFAHEKLEDHKFVMVLHDHQANPHVHISVRAESRQGRRLNPRKADLHRWREVFAEKLRSYGIDAEATRQATRGATRNHPDLWRVKAQGEGRLMKPRPAHRGGSAARASREEARDAWKAIAEALAGSSEAGDRRLAESIRNHIRDAHRDRSAPTTRVTAELPQQPGSKDAPGLTR